MRKLIFLICLIVSVPSIANTVEDTRVFLVGAGTNSNDLAPSTSWSVGFIGKTNDSWWGVDLAGEGYSLDSTYNQDEDLDSALSLNVMWGKEITENFILMGVLGARDKASECNSQSYIGFQCYADSEPEVSYGINYGINAIYMFEKITLGTRITGESSQLTFGYKY
jgi:hypothetical protein